MKISIISFTENGAKLSEMVSEKLGEQETERFTKCTYFSGTGESVRKVDVPVVFWAGEQMAKGNGLIFIGACGIAVRAIAPHIVSKLSDSPVIVIDEKGDYVIPILSGHIGGANELACRIAECIGAVPVITTATDIRKKFAADLFAKKNGLFIENKEALSVKNSGSVQELLEFSNKICYQSFGVETRLWKTGEEIPAIGEWNEQVSAAEADDSVLLDFSEEDLMPQVIIDAFVKNSLFKKDFDSDSLIEKIYPYYKYFSSELKKSTLLNLKRRHDILKKSYNYFADYNAACVRSDVLELFSRVNELMSRISIECTDIKNLPSQELVVLSQIYQHLVKFLEFFQFDDVDKSLGDIKVSVDNMTFTFDVISEDLIRALVIEGRKGFKIGEN